MHVIYWEYLGQYDRIGPFDTYVEAEEWAAKYLYGSWSVLSLFSPEHVINWKNLQEVQDCIAYGGSICVRTTKAAT